MLGDSDRYRAFLFNLAILRHVSRVPIFLASTTESNNHFSSRNKWMTAVIVALMLITVGSNDPLSSPYLISHQLVGSYGAAYVFSGRGWKPFDVKFIAGFFPL